MSGSGFLARFARGSRSSPANVTNGDRLGFNVFGGWAGGAFRHTGAIEALVDTGTVSASSLPTYMKFSTTPDGSASRAERMRIDSAGRVSINTISPYAGAKLEVVNDNTTDGARAIYGETSSGTTQGVRGKHTGSGNYGYLGGSTSGVYGQSTSDNGVRGDSTDGRGVYGSSSNDAGVWGQSNSDVGVYGQSSSDVGVYGPCTPWPSVLWP